MRLAIILAGCLIGASLSATLAQDETEPDEDTSITVAIGDVDYELLRTDPIQACVYERNEDADGVDVRYRLFVIEEGIAYTVGSYHAPANDTVFEEVAVLECIGMIP